MFLIDNYYKLGEFIYEYLFDFILKKLNNKKNIETLIF